MIGRPGMGMGGPPPMMMMVGGGGRPGGPGPHMGPGPFMNRGGPGPGPGPGPAPGPMSPRGGGPGDRESGGGGGGPEREARGEDRACFVCGKTTHIARDLVRFFVSDNPPSSLVTRIAAGLRGSDFDIREAMRAIFKSREFYSPESMHARIKSPPEFVVGSVKALGISPDECDFWTLARAMGEMGQQLFQPPNVKGWDGGTTWITSTTLVNRARFVAAVQRGDGERAFARRQTRLKEVEDIRAKLAAALRGRAEFTIQPWQVPLVRRKALDPGDLLAGSREWTSVGIVDHLVERLIAKPIGPQVRSELLRVLGEPRRPAGGRPPADASPRILRLIEAIMSLPEFHLG